MRTAKIALSCLIGLAFLLVFAVTGEPSPGDVSAVATNSGAERSGPLCPPRPATAEEQASRARKDAIAEGLELEARLARPLASCDRAPLEHRLAKTYERIPGKGNLARAKPMPGYWMSTQATRRLHR